MTSPRLWEAGVRFGLEDSLAARELDKYVLRDTPAVRKFGPEE